MAQALREAYTGYFEKRMLPVFRFNFVDAVCAMAKEIKAQTGAKPQLRVAFYTAANDEKPHLEIIDPECIPFMPWHDADKVVATCTVAANDSSNELTARIQTKAPDPTAIRFEISPDQRGQKILTNVLRDDKFTFWLKGIRY